MWRDRLTWALAGVAAAAVAVGVGEFAAGLLGGSSIVVAIGTLVISLQPPGAKDLMVALFGEYDKLVLEMGVATGGLAVGALIGLIGRRDMRAALAGFVGFGLFAAYLIVQDPLSSVLAAGVSVVPAVVGGMLTLEWLRRLIERVPAPERAPAPAPQPASRGVSAPLARRSFIAIGAMFVAVGGVLAIIGRYVGSQLPTSVGPSVPIPSAGQTLPPVPAAAELGIDGLSPIVVPNEDFYRIDTRLTVPNLDSSSWSLRVHGMVEREITLRYEDLLAKPLYERFVTISCVSNEVGGYLVGNAKWTGVSLVSVLNAAGVKPGATQLVGRSFDGWTSGFPTEHLSGAGSEAMIAVQMNGEPLPPAHGFPARLIVPGLYGYVSATKWLTEIELTTLEAFDPYWIPLGWAKLAPILTQSRIDVPRSGATVRPGSVTAAGVAWAPTRGITQVEVQLDDGAWQVAQLSQPLSNYAWVQWRVNLDLAAGAHTLTARATDGTGTTQTSDRTPPAPDGARGYHQVRVNAA